MTQSELPADVDAAMKEQSRIFGRYVLLQQLGRGGMGTVYKAWQIPLRRYVAIKILHEGESEDNLARFMREAQTASQVQHQNICAVYEVGNHAGRFFIAMQYIDGVTLDGLFERKLEREKLLKILRAASLAIHAAHERGVVHRDIKPSNIMLSREGRPYVLDFGIARRLRGGDTLTEAGMVVGTPTYMAPEQASGNPETVDRRSDVWSLGVILYEILTGSVPFRGRTPAETLMFLVNEDPPPPSRKARDVPRELEAVCMKALERERRRRYATAEAFAEDIQRWLDGTAVSAKPLTIVERAARRLKRLRARLLAGAGALLLGGAVWLALSVVARTEREKTRAEARQAEAREEWDRAVEFWTKLGSDPEALQRKGECQRRVRELKEKVELRAGQQDMDQADASYRKAMIVISQPGQHEKLRTFLREAERDARSAVRAHVKEPQWHMQLGRILYELRDPGCITAFSKAIELDGALVEAYYLRAKMNMTLCFDALILESLSSRGVDALLLYVRRDLKAATERGLDPDKQALIEALVLASEERYAEAEACLRKLSAKAAEELDVQTTLARLNLHAGQGDAADACFARLRTLRPNDPFLLLWWSEAAFTRRDSDAGMQRLRESAALDPENLVLRHHIANILLDGGALDAALKEFEFILERDPKNYAALIGKADALEDSFREKEAVPVFAKAVDGRDGLSDNSYIAALAQSGDSIRALDESTAVLKHLEIRATPYANRVRMNLHWLRGGAYRRLNQPASALRELEEALRLGLRDAQTHFAAAEALIDVGQDLDRAEQYIHRGLKLSSTKRDLALADYCAKRLARARGQNP